jgi:hypothetical protein
MASNHRRLAVSEYQILTTEAAAAEVAEGVPGTANLAEALALTEGYSEIGDWIYSATAEGRTGEVAVNGIDLDGEPGLIYSGPAGAAVGVTFEGIGISEGTIAPEATDGATLALFKNNDLVDYADEGFVLLTGETVHDMNLSTYVAGLQTGDVLRVGLVGSGSEVIDVDIAPGDVRVI